MKMVCPNCRDKFTAADIDFILSVLSKDNPTKPDIIENLFSDADSSDIILDNEALFQALLDRSECLELSPQFYFIYSCVMSLNSPGLTIKKWLIM